MEMDIINLVGKLKKEYGTADPFGISEKMGIEIRYVPFLENPKGQFQELLGYPVILLNESLKDSEERFYICAHELGHALFHKEISSYYVSTRNSRSKSESEANCFAANLIADLYKEDTQLYPRKIEDLSRLYGLPFSAYRFLI
ncbi:ImmA/IrrE family metallo-endopeptidase [Enterococcus sp. C50]|uniref:ImmA/IrrE family metallo-endopeptidase n=1 Tax=Enterococcus sp. C50 TaxID=3231311 RepID=UPI0034A01B38